MTRGARHPGRHQSEHPADFIGIRSIDRLGQRYPKIRIINLHYANTVEADVYRALRERIGLFENVVGRLQPILAQLPTLISKRVLEGKAKPEGERQAAVAEIENATDRLAAAGFNIDEVTDAELNDPTQPPPPLVMHDLERVIATRALLAPGIEVNTLGLREYALRQPGQGAQVRVSTDPVYYEENAETVELWSPGNPTFPELPSAFPAPDVPYLADLLALTKPTS